MRQAAMRGIAQIAFPGEVKSPRRVFGQQIWRPKIAVRRIWSKSRPWVIRPCENVMSRQQHDVSRAKQVLQTLQAREPGDGVKRIDIVKAVVWRLRKQGKRL